MKALLFDFDGTLVDTESPSYRSWQEIYADLGHDLPLSRWAAAVGTVDGFDPLADLEQLVGEGFDASATRERRVGRELELLAVEALRPGVEHYLRDARRLGLKVGIVSSSSDEWIQRNLERVAGTETWDCIASANRDPKRAKPSPLGVGETAVSPTCPLPSRQTRLRAGWLRRAKPGCACKPTSDRRARKRRRLSRAGGVPPARERSSSGGSKCHVPS